MSAGSNLGATVLLYTDGLVERRGATIDDGLTWLAEATAGLSGLPLADLCDELLDQVAGHAEDDIALLGLRRCGPAVLARS